MILNEGNFFFFFFSANCLLKDQIWVGGENYFYECYRGDSDGEIYDLLSINLFDISLNFHQKATLVIAKQKTSFILLLPGSHSCCEETKETGRLCKGNCEGQKCIAVFNW